MGVQSAKCRVQRKIYHGDASRPLDAETGRLGDTGVRRGYYKCDVFYHRVTEITEKG